jgi:Na+/proline symporter
VIGNFIGYVIIAFVLLPLYYKMNLTSIYKYLEERFGMAAHKTGASFFILSRTLGATARLYLVVNILQIFVFEKINIGSMQGIPFWLTALVILLMILLYTFEGGVKTIVYTDTLQTLGMIIGVAVSITVILNALDLNLWEAFTVLKKENLTRVVDSDILSKSFIIKSLLGGIFTVIAMTGLDQEMMQKNISVNKLKDSQKNMITYGSVLILVKITFLFLGGLLFLYARAKGINVPNDDLYPTIAIQSHLASAISIIFIIALISALCPSVDGAITALTSSYCIDMADLNRRADLDDKQKKRFRLTVHIAFAIVFFIMVLIFKAINDKFIIDFVLKLAGFTYGPLLGLFAFGILTKRKLYAKYVVLICITCLFLTMYIDFWFDPEWYQKKFGISESTIAPAKALSKEWFGGYKIGYELILINGLITFFGLRTISYKTNKL